MSAIPSLLTKAVDIEKQAQFEFIRDFTASTIAHLMKGGVDLEKASGFAKEACYKHPVLVEKVRQIAVLEKTAKYVEELEAEVETLKGQVKQAEEQVPAMPESLQKLAKIGFTPEELQYLDSVPNELVEKVASAVTEPWQLGKAAGVDSAPNDPLLDFILK